MKNVRKRVAEFHTKTFVNNITYVKLYVGNCGIGWYEYNIKIIFLQ